MIAWRTVSEMTYNVSNGMLNLTHSLTHSLTHLLWCWVGTLLCCLVMSLWRSFANVCRRWKWCLPLWRLSICSIWSISWSVPMPSCVQCLISVSLSNSVFLVALLVSLIVDKVMSLASSCEVGFQLILRKRAALHCCLLSATCASGWVSRC